jgi:multidrug efflux pump subunit AcrA (membrane-fusion protein)
MQHILAVIAMFPFGMAAMADTVDVPVRVLTYVASPPEALSERRFFGRIVARETLDLAFDIGGRIEDMTVEAGDCVSAGALIAQLRLSPLMRAVERSRINLDTATRELLRAQAQEALADATLSAPFDSLIVERLVPPLSVVQLGQAHVLISAGRCQRPKRDPRCGGKRKRPRGVSYWRCSSMIKG